MSATSQLNGARPRKSNNERNYQLGLLGGFRLTTLFRLLPLMRHADLPGVPRILLALGLSVATLPLRLAQSALLGRRIRRAPIDESPVFVIGHWRSGTTHLHNLLTRDEQFGFPSMFQAVAPDASLLGGARLRKLLSRRTPTRRPMDNMRWSLELPQEEEIILGKACPGSFYAQFLFPRQSTSLFRRTVEMKGIAPRARRRWKREYLRLLRVATLHSGGRRLVLKNPVNTGRIETLLEMFPNAKFVFIHRSPYRVFLSTRNLYHRILSFSSMQRISDVEIESTVLARYDDLMSKYLSERAAIPAENLVEVSYDDLTRAPQRELRRIYAKLGIEGFERAEPAFASYLASQRDYRKNEFELSERDRRLVNRHWGFAFDEWGYERQESALQTRQTAATDAQAPA